MLLFAAALAFQPTQLVADCPDGTGIAALECRAQLAVEASDHASAADFFLQIADQLESPERKASALAAAAPLFALSGQLELAASVAQDALALETLPPLQTGWTKLDRAQALFRLDQRAEAEALWTSAYDEISEDPYYWHIGASMALQDQRIEDADSRVDNGLDRADDSPELLLLKGQIALAREDMSAARDAFRRAILAQADHPAGLAAAQALRALGEE